jgi:integrase
MSRAHSRGRGWRATESSPLRFNRDFTRNGIGRITNSSRTTDIQEFRRRDLILTKLYESGQFDVLRAFKNGALHIEELVEAEREGRLRSSELLSYLSLKRALWIAIEESLPQMGRSTATRKRYRVSLLKSLREKAADSLPTGARVSDLERVRWAELKQSWGKSAADWNHMRRALSAFLTVLMGDKYSPFRRRVIQTIPIANEVGRVPDLTPRGFRAILEHIPDRYRCCYYALVATGLRVGEYLRLTSFNLKPATRSISGVGTKTALSAEDVAVYSDLWHYVEAAVPSPLGYKALRRHWVAACKKAGVAIRIHDLRHCFGQWAIDSGVPESKVQTALRHKSASMTRRYTKTREKGEAANAVGRALLGESNSETPAQVVAQGGTRGKA